MYSVIDYDPMLLESSLPYPKTLDETVLIVRAQDIPKLILPENAGQESVIGAGSGCMKVAEAGNLGLFESQLLLHLEQVYGRIDQAINMAQHFWPSVVNKLVTWSMKLMEA